MVLLLDKLQDTPAPKIEPTRAQPPQQEGNITTEQLLEQFEAIAPLFSWRIKHGALRGNKKRNAFFAPVLRLGQFLGCADEDDVCLITAIVFATTGEFFRPGDFKDAASLLHLGGTLADLVVRSVDTDSVGDKLGERIRRIARV